MSGSDIGATTLTSTSAQILYPILVNGLVCNNAVEAQAARAGENPAALAGAASGSGVSTPPTAVSRTQTEYAVQGAAAGSGSARSESGDHETDLFA